MFRMLGGHDRVHLAQARRALARSARATAVRLGAPAGVALHQLGHRGAGRRPLGLVAEDLAVRRPSGAAGSSR